MKRILIVMPSLVGGGAEKSLVTLLQALGEEHNFARTFQVDLFLFERTGLFLSQVPSWVRVTDAGEAYKIFTGSAKVAARWFLRHGRPWLLPARWRYAKACRAPEQERALRCWRALRHVLPRLPGAYDCAIAYLEGFSSYFAADKQKVRAKKRVAWFHNDYAKLPHLFAANKVFLPRLNALVSVSERCCDALREAFPALADRVVKIENIVPRAAIAELAREPVASAPDILTIARLSTQKGVDLAIRAAGILKRRGVCFTWGVVGTGGSQAALQQLIEEEGLTDCFFLLGEQANPYPALRACKIYVQPSRWEGKSIAIEEAKALQKPIICTRFGTVLEQIDDGRTGLVCKIAPASIAEAVQKLLEAPALRAQFIQNLKGLPGNETEAEKFLALWQ